MKKVLLSLILVFSLFFSFGNFQVNAEIQKEKQEKIQKILNNYFFKKIETDGLKKTSLFLEKINLYIEKNGKKTNNNKSLILNYIHFYINEILKINDLSFNIVKEKKYGDYKIIIFEKNTGKNFYRTRENKYIYTEDLSKKFLNNKKDFIEEIKIKFVLYDFKNKTQNIILEKKFAEKLMGVGDFIFSEIKILGKYKNILLFSTNGENFFTETTNYIYNLNSNTLKKIKHNGIIENIKKGKSGIYFTIGGGQENISLFKISNNLEIKKIYEDNSKIEDFGNNVLPIKWEKLENYELLENGEIKLFLKVNIGNNLIKKEKIIFLNIKEKFKEITIGGKIFKLEKDKLEEGLEGKYFYNDLFITTLDGIKNVCGLYSNKIPKTISYKCDGPLIKGNKYVYCESKENNLSQFEFGIITEGGGCGGYGEKWQKIYIKKINGTDFIFVGNLKGKGPESDKGHNKYDEIYKKYANKEYLYKILKDKDNINLIEKWDKIVENFVSVEK